MGVGGGGWGGAELLISEIFGMLWYPSHKHWLKSKSQEFIGHIKQHLWQQAFTHVSSMAFKIL